ncbi:MAG: 3'-5' exonuclease [Thermodesulfobacteriota bacterium]
MDHIEQYKRKFDGDEINGLPLGGFTGEIRMVTDLRAAAAAVRSLRREKVLGFDTETRPSFRKGKSYDPSLVQLAGSRRVYIFQFSRLPRFPQGLADLLADPGIVKAGVSVRDDVLGLKRLHDFADAGFMDLGDLARKVDIPTHGLRNLAANLLGIRISKSARCTNWSRPDLSAKQVRYAATDAWISRELYLAFARLGLAPALV